MDRRKFLARTLGAAVVMPAVVAAATELDTYVTPEEAREYVEGRVYGSEEGTPIQDVVQAILDHADTGMVARWEPEPEVLILPYRQPNSDPIAAVSDLLRLIGYHGQVAGRHGRVLVCRDYHRNSPTFLF